MIHDCCMSLVTYMTYIYIYIYITYLYISLSPAGNAHCAQARWRGSTPMRPYGCTHVSESVNAVNSLEFDFRSFTVTGSNPRVEVCLDPNMPFENSKSWNSGRVFFFRSNFDNCLHVSLRVRVPVPSPACPCEN